MVGCVNRGFPSAWELKIHYAPKLNKKHQNENKKKFEFFIQITGCNMLDVAGVTRNQVKCSIF